MATHAAENRIFTAYPEYSEGGYADRRTVRQGETITFFIANDLQKFQARILRVAIDPLFGKSRTTYKQIVKRFDIKDANDPRAPCSIGAGCDWKPTFSISIPRRWRSGWYRVEFPVKHSGEYRYIDFIVAEAEPQANILFLFDTQTAQAYNVYGGGSLYGGFDAQGEWSILQRSSQVSWRRPVVRSHNYAPAPRINDPVWTPHEEEAFRIWLESKFRVAYLSIDALPDFGLEFLQRYRLLVIVGQQEYWSNEQLDLVRSYVSGGGRLYLSAIEFAYAAIRHDRQTDVISYYYDPRDDPYFTTAPDRLATVRAAVANVGDFFGVSLAYGIGLGLGHGIAPLRLVSAAHPVCVKAGFTTGDVIAGIRGLGVGAWVEQDSAGTHRIASARLRPEQVDILATAPYPPLIPREHGPAEYAHDNFNHPLIDRLIHGEARHTVASVPEHTCAVAAFIRQGDGEMFVGPGGWLNSPHPDNLDPRTRKLIHNIIDYLLDY